MWLEFNTAIMQARVASDGLRRTAALSDLMRGDYLSLLTICVSSGIHPRSSFRVPTDFGDNTEDPMLLRASHFATAASAATGRSNRPNGWQLVGVCVAYTGVPSSKMRSIYGSRLKPE